MVRRVRPLLFEIDLIFDVFDCRKGTKDGEGFQHISTCFSLKVMGIQSRSTSPRGGTEELLHKYDLDVFVDVVKAIKEANREGSDGK